MPDNIYRQTVKKIQSYFQYTCIITEKQFKYFFVNLYFPLRMNLLAVLSSLLASTMATPASDLGNR